MADQHHPIRKSGFNKVSSTTAFVCGAMRLKVQQDCLDKMQPVVINNMKSVDRHLVKEIEEMYTNMERKRMQESEKLHQLLATIVVSLKDLKMAICNDDRLKNLDVDSYRQDLIELENKITATKDSNDRELIKLGFDENVLWDHVQSVERKIDEWSKPLQTTALKAQCRSWTKPCTSYQESYEVMNFTKFLQETGGHTGGWDEADHLLFVRLRRKYGDRNRFLEGFRHEMPDMTLDQVLEHEGWFIKYEVLKQHQKKAIEEWRACKSKTKPRQVVSEEPVTINKSSKLTDKETAAEKKQKIEDWKKLKQTQKELEEAKRLEEKKKQLAEWEKKKEKQEIQRAQLVRYKEEKMNRQYAYTIKKQLREMEEIEEKAAMANKALKAYREQDQEYVARLKCRRAQRSSQQEDRTQFMRQRAHVMAERDPQRLLQFTQVWKERLRKLTEADTPVFGKPVLHLRNIPHLAVPSWRKGLT